jgi:hypothetical protein
MGGVVDVLWGRAAETEAGGGGYLGVSTAGFRDLRPALGLSGIVSVIEWFTLGGRAGGLIRIDDQGVAPGFEGFLELGHRSVSLRSGYSLSHALFGGLQWVAPLYATESAQTTLWIGLRIDAVWLTAPRFFF